MNQLETNLHLQAAFFCEDVLIEDDQTLSFKKLITRYQVEVNNGSAPLRMPIITVEPTIVIALTATNMTGMFEIEIKPIRPDGSEMGRAMLPFEIEQPGYVKPTFTKIQIPLEIEGTYWFELYFRGDIVTRMPLLVTYLRGSKPKETVEGNAEAVGQL